ncbi:hypothetical protein ES703_63415 [subsurface metagenome]
MLGAQVSRPIYLVNGIRPKRRTGKWVKCIEDQLPQALLVRGELVYVCAVVCGKTEQVGVAVPLTVPRNPHPVIQMVNLNLDLGNPQLPRQVVMIAAHVRPALAIGIRVLGPYKQKIRYDTVGRVWNRNCIYPTVGNT